MSSSNVSPLTTLFVPPNSCLTDVYWYSFTSGQSPQVLGTGIGADASGTHYLGLPGHRAVYRQHGLLQAITRREFVPEAIPLDARLSTASGR